MKLIYTIIFTILISEAVSGVSVYEQDPIEIATGEVSGEPVDYGEMC